MTQYTNPHIPELLEYLSLVLGAGVGMLSSVIVAKLVVYLLHGETKLLALSIFNANKHWVFRLTSFGYHVVIITPIIYSGLRLTYTAEAMDAFDIYVVVVFSMILIGLRCAARRTRKLERQKQANMTILPLHATKITDTGTQVSSADIIEAVDPTIVDNEKL
ncbi:hypothetical protein BDQ12DRAFT_686480 [Crucibulum laeve]|uniref:Uncharacterized protein n=1 Tax=Crucibulum laeve TaxID=68775 RepID=A0A5C3LV91_9AGAR|nr:hypothetical protein BDQ12DRAFT_686480 [Crucibulum laeve]